MSNKQRGYIIWRLENELPEVFKQVPKNNPKYPNELADYRRVILEDMIRNFSMDNAQTLIQLIKDKDERAVETFIFGITYKQ